MIEYLEATTNRSSPDKSTSSVNITATDLNSPNNKKAITSDEIVKPVRHFFLFKAARIIIQYFIIILLLKHPLLLICMLDKLEECQQERPLGPQLKYP